MRRRIQFSLRALMLATMVTAAFFGGVKFGEVREQRRLAVERARLKAASARLALDAAAVQRANEALSALKAARSYPDLAERLIEVEQSLSKANP